MYSTPTLATRFARNTRVMRADQPLSEDQMRAAAPSIFAQGKHASRSERYTYIPTIDVLRGLRNEGFEPFMVAQGASRVEGKAEFTKHMIRMRHASQVNGSEANEIILLNSHDGTSSYQMLAGMAKSDEVLGVFAPVFVAHAGLAHHEGLEPLLAQLGQHGRGRYVGIPFGPAPMRSVGKDRWSNGTDAVIREWAIGTQDRGLRGKTGCQRHGCSPWRNATTARP